MANVYALDTERNLILYPSGQNIFLGTSIGKAFTRAVSLCNDYYQNLSDVIYKGTIYFSYQNNSHDIIIRSITDTEPVFQILQHEIPDCFAPRLFVFQDNLLLFYSVKNPLDDTYLLKGIFPDEKTKRFHFPTSFADIPNVTPLITDTLSLICILAGNQISFWQIGDNLSLSKLKLINENALSDKYNAEIAHLRQELSTRDTMIESAKRQYNELMDTATKYREEAIKWRNKFWGN